VEAAISPPLAVCGLPQHIVVLFAGFLPNWPVLAYIVVLYAGFLPDWRVLSAYCCTFCRIFAELAVAERILLYFVQDFRRIGS
jgi:hypothetical protein